MKRTPFRRKIPARPQGRQCDYTPRPRAVAVAIADHRARMSGPVPKRTYVRSESLMEAYRLIPCQHCGRDDGTVCGAHANWSIFGKGGHIKADDSRAASLCSLCHVPVLDQGSKLTRAERQAMWWAAHVKTVIELGKRALWPARVPVPDISINPFLETA